MQTSTEPSDSEQETAEAHSLTSAPDFSANCASQWSNLLLSILSPSCSKRYSLPFSSVRIIPILLNGSHFTESGTSAPKHSLISSTLFLINIPEQDLFLGKANLSVSKTLYPLSDNVFAAVHPAGPAPIIITSYILTICLSKRLKHFSVCSYNYASVLDIVINIHIIQKANKNSSYYA